MECGQRMQGKLSAAFLLAAAAVMLLFMLTACGREDTPEKQIEKLVDKGKAAAENGKPGELRELISGRYADDHGRTRRDIVALAARYLYVNKNIHLFTRIRELTFSGSDAARLRIYAAMAGQDVSGPDALRNIRADLYFFDLDLAHEEGEWRVVRADWRPAGWEEFF
jgi:hypothetical protein